MCLGQRARALELLNREARRVDICGDSERVLNNRPVKVYTVS